MSILRGCNTLLLIEISNTYACIDRTTGEVKQKGNLDECNEFFNAYINFLRRI
jgi:hypothetical protein